MSLLFKYTIMAKNFTVSVRNGKSTAVEHIFTFQGDTQPLSSRQIMSLTQGRKSSGFIRVFSESKLSIGVEGDSENGRGTYVMFDGDWYEVVSGDTWNSQISELKDINHYEYNAEYRSKEVIT